jgi:hypothetical protein
LKFYKFAVDFSERENRLFTSLPYGGKFTRDLLAHQIFSMCIAVFQWIIKTSSLSNFPGLHQTHWGSTEDTNRRALAQTHPVVDQRRHRRCWDQVSPRHRWNVERWMCHRTASNSFLLKRENAVQIQFFCFNFTQKNFLLACAL